MSFNLVMKNIVLLSNFIQNNTLCEIKYNSYDLYELYFFR